MADFTTAYRIVQTNEGWSGQVALDNNKARVRYGINEAFWPNMPAGFYDGTMDDPTALAVAEGHYRTVDWVAVQGDKIPSQFIANHLLDAGVNTGDGGAVETLQAVLNDKFGMGLKIDGGMGPVTLAAVLARPDIEESFRRARVGYYVAKSLEPQGRGWLDAWLTRLQRCGG